MRMLVFLVLIMGVSFEITTRAGTLNEAWLQGKLKRPPKATAL
jgi:hypothetical protein